MKVDKMLEYQKLDSEMFKIEKQLRENSNRQNANQMHENMKNAQSRSLKLEEKAGALFAEIEKVKKQVAIQESKMDEFLNKDLSKMSKEEVDQLAGLKNKLAQNLQILEKNLTTLAESMNAVLADFNKTIKAFNLAKEEYAKSKTAWQADRGALRGQYPSQRRLYPRW